MSRDDDRIADRLNEDIESVISKYWPSWIKVREKGQDVALLTPAVKKGQKKPTSSFKVELSGPHRGRWFRFSQNVGGWGVHLLAYGEFGRIPSSKEDWRETFQAARQHLGIEDRQESAEEAAEREKRKAVLREQREREAAQRKAEAAAKAAERTASAEEAWKGSLELASSQGEAYLVERGLPPVSEWPWNPKHVLRFHPALDYEPNKRVGLLPAVIGKIQDEYGRSTSIWQIFLKPGKPEKADLSPSPKVGRGPASGGAVRLGGIGPHIGIAEGIETALAAWVLLGFKYPVWAGLSTGGVSGFEPPMEVERISIVPDSDLGQMDRTGRISDPPGIAAAKKLKARMDAAGIRCNVLEICALGDALDLLNTRRRHEQKSGNAATSDKSRGGESGLREGISGGV